MRSGPLHDPVTDELQSKIKTLHSSIWERRADWPEVLDWLDQFEEHDDPDADEQLQALRLLSNFMYFGVNEIRALLRSLFRDTFRPQVAKEVRSGLPSTAAVATPPAAILLEAMSSSIRRASSRSARRFASSLVGALRGPRSIAPELLMP